MKAQEVITEKTYNGIPISEIKIDCKEFDMMEFFDKYGWGDAAIVVEILELNGCLIKT
jgi:hypothetical protein